MDLKLHNRDVIPKLIYDLFIKRPLQEMIKRVTGGKKMGGIYKITYKKTGEAYIGKTSSDFGTRWTNHVKTALGLDGCAHATLHTRLAQDGLWNYTFEILEEVDKEKQSEREAFYINLYGTKK
ncbi:MAG: GIY-YIG nuclease family protein [Lachnospiraceae bacterium]|nr:GIY-YIG nuclease family protein [Lachnospiraceae bacterium]